MIRFGGAIVRIKKLFFLGLAFHISRMKKIHWDAKNTNFFLHQEKKKVFGKNTEILALKVIQTSLR